MKTRFHLQNVQFFDRQVLDGLSKAARRVLSKFGAYVMRSAKSSIRSSKARLKEGELPREQRRQHQIRLRLFEQGKLRREPQLPFKPSLPGRPPKVHRSKSPLKLILFAWDAREQSVTVGPVAFGRRPGVAPQALEEGGVSSTRSGRRVNIAARPFMEPAFTQNLPHLQQWRNAL